MKVIHVVNDANTGGAQTLIEQLAIEMRDDVESFVLVLLGEGTLSDRFEAVAKNVEYLRIGKSPSNLIALVKGTRGYLRRIRPDVVHSHLFQSDLAVVLANFASGIPHVSTVHTTGVSRFDPPLTHLLSRTMGLISRWRVDVVVACGQGAALFMSQRNYPRAKSETIANGTAVDGQAARLHSRKFSFVSLSRWHPMKDHETLFRAFQNVVRAQPSARLTCAGNGMDLGNRELASWLDRYELSENVNLIGPVKSVRGLLSVADALVISSSYGEALPMAGIEALASSTPVITTDIGDCSRLALIPELLVKPRDAEGLTKAMLHLEHMDNRSYRRLRERAHKVAQTEFDIQSTARSYIQVYRSLLDAKSRKW